jgi:hypothetical protein
VNPYPDIESAVSSATSLEDGALALERLLSGGYAVWTDGSLYSIKQLVERFRGLKIEIFPREHPPPHFHVSAADIDATFSLTDCELLQGHVPARELALIKWWYARSRPLLVNTWNRTRPSNCPVGPIIA